METQVYKLRFRQTESFDIYVNGPANLSSVELEKLAIDFQNEHEDLLEMCIEVGDCTVTFDGAAVAEDY